MAKIKMHVDGCVITLMPQKVSAAQLEANKAVRDGIRQQIQESRRKREEQRNELQASC